jgi:protein-tyrosine phosphatase
LDVAVAEAFGVGGGATLSATGAGSALPALRSGAEVLLSHRLSAHKEELSPLFYEGTRHILLELPYAPYEPWMSEEVWNIRAACGAVPVMAHLDRYLSSYSREEMRDILSAASGIVIQINADAFYDRKKSRFALDIMDAGLPLVVGSDAHNLTSRRPELTAFRRFLRKHKRGQELAAHIRRSEFL